MAKTKEVSETTTIDEMQPVAESVTAAIVESPTVAPGYVLIRLKSGKGGEVKVKESMMKHYPEDKWTITAQAQKKTPSTVKK